MRRWFLILFLILGLGCAGVNAGPPAPQAEIPIPSVIKFPGTLEIDVVSPSGSLSALMGMREVADGGEFSAVIQTGEDLTAAVNDFNDVVLAVWDGLEIPVETTRTTFESDDGDVKIDFAAFDFDFGDGNTDACTGCTCPTGCSGTCPTEAVADDLLPLCYRIWTLNDETEAFERLLIGRLYTLPDDPNPGEGVYRSYLLTETSDGFPDERTMSVIYDHVDDDSSFKSNDLQLVRDIYDSDGTTVTQEERIHAEISQQTVAAATTGEDEVLKESGLDYEIYDDSNALTDFIEYAARFFEDEFFWRGNLFSPDYSMDNQCVDLRTGDAADDEICDDLDASDIDTTVITADDVTFPSTAIFPNDPTF